MRLLFIFLLLTAGVCSGQTAYFIDGYHGGIYGHIPPWQTRFMVDKLKEFPDWKINLELEPESWDTIKLRDRAAYDAFVRQVESGDGRVEYINPAYGQSYLYTITGESVIRQFYYGIKKLREHFPSIQFGTYSSEEPCFTSALPQILRSYGFKYAALKNPNTCWGGYTRAYGGELVDWVGPDGSKIVAAPRYAMEALVPGSTWQTMAYTNSEAYVRGAFAAGIKHPVGMTLQDAGWAYGPWQRGKMYAPTEYITWREYFEKIAVGSSHPEWKFSQEDVLVSLMWGSQVLQKIALQVRAAENKLLQAEKVAAMRFIETHSSWPGDSLDLAWKNLLLAQHHDCWIVPYNGKPGDTWADKVVVWTGTANRIADWVMRDSGGGAVLNHKIYNTTARARKEWIEVNGKVVFADVPAMGYGRLKVGGGADASVIKQEDGLYRIETDLYRIILDPAHGGVIKSLRAKKLGDKEFVGEGFNGLRGNFYNEGGFHGSADTAAEVRIVENGRRLKLEIRGSIAGDPFTQVLTVAAGEPRIDCSLRIGWRGNPGIGESAGPSSDKEVRKSYYDDRYKLLALFPPAFAVGKVFKNAPFDVTESRLTNTFFSRWDSIKNNVLLNWVDVEDSSERYGLALFCDHTTSYVHGEGYPLGLTIQYSGNGIFYRNYGISGPAEVHYALLPHAGGWDRAGVEEEAARWNEPLVVLEGREQGVHSFLHPEVKGWVISSMRMEGRDLLVRVYNAEGDDRTGVLRVGFKGDAVWMEELDGRRIKKFDKEVRLAIPRFGIRTLRFKNVKSIL